MKFYTVENNKKSIFKTFAIYYTCMALFCLMRILVSLGCAPDGLLGEIYVSVLIQVGILFILPLIFYSIFLKVKPKEIFKTCNFGKINFNVVLISIVLGILCFFINVAVSSLFSGIINFTGYRSSGSGGTANYETWHFFVEVFIVAVLPAFCEEFLHRGIVLQGIKHIGFKKAIVISSLLFGLLHFNIQQVSYAFVVGLILGFVAVVSKNIFPSIIIHFVNNFISVYLDYAANRNWFLGDFLNNLQSSLYAGSMFAVFIISAIVMIVIVALLCLFIWLLYKQTLIRKVNKVLDKVYNSPELDPELKIVIDQENQIRDFLETNTLLNLDFEKKDNPIDIVMPKEKSRYKTKLTDYIFLWGAVFLGGLVTLFTYIWGLF